MKNDKEIRDLFSSLAENEHPDRAVACAQVGACLVRFSQSVRVAFDHHLSSWSESTVIAVKQHYADTFSQHEGETYLLAGWLYFNYQFQTWPTQPNAKALNWVYHMSRRVAKILSESLARVGGPVNYARLHAVLCEQFNMTVEFVPPIVVPNKLALHLSLLQPFIQEIYVCFHNVDSNPQMNGFPRWFSGWQNFELRYLKNKKEPVYVYAKEVTVQPNKTMINKKQSLESLITQNKWSLLYTIVLERTGDENQRVLIQAREELSNQTISPSQKLIQSEKNVQTASFIPKDVWKFGIFPHLLPKDRASAGGTCHFLHAMNREFNQFRWEFPNLFAQRLAQNLPINPQVELVNARAIAYDSTIPDLATLYSAVAAEDIPEVIASHETLWSTRSRTVRAIDVDLLTLVLKRDNLALSLFVVAHRHKDLSSHEIFKLAIRYGASAILKMIVSHDGLQSLKIRLTDLEEYLMIACKQRHYQTIALLMDEIYSSENYHKSRHETNHETEPLVSFKKRIFGPYGSLILISMQRYSEFRDEYDVYHLVKESARYYSHDLRSLMSIPESTLKILGRMKLKYQAMYWGMLYGRLEFMKTLMEIGITLDSFSKEEQSFLVQTLIAALHTFTRELSCTDDNLDLKKVVEDFNRSEGWCTSLEQLSLKRANRVSQYLMIVKLHLPKIIELVNGQEFLVKLVVDSDNQEFIECLRSGGPAIDVLTRFGTPVSSVGACAPKSHDLDPRLHTAMQTLNEIELYIVSKTLNSWNLGAKQSRFRITIAGIDYKVPHTIAMIYHHIESFHANAPSDFIPSLESTYRAISACIVEKDKFRLFPKLRKEDTRKSYEDIAKLLAKRFRAEDPADTLLTRTQCLEKLYSLNGKKSSYLSVQIGSSHY